MLPERNEDETEWMEDAKCRNLTPSLFFFDKKIDDVPYMVKQAKSICRACVVREECLDYAVRFNMSDGIWGATTPRERRRLRKQRGLAVPRITNTVLPDE